MSNLYYARNSDIYHNNLFFIYHFHIDFIDNFVLFSSISILIRNIFRYRDH